MASLKLIGALAAAVAISGAVPAHAIGFSFTVTGDASHPGTFGGTVTGLSDNTANQHGNVDLQNSTIGFNVPFPYGTTNDATTDSFTVTNGVVTGATYFASRTFGGTFGTYALELTAPVNGLPGVNSLAIKPGNFPSALISNSAGLTGITFVPLVGSVSVPEPSTLALLGAGLLSVPVIRRRRRRR